jgi:hypothetical protein
MYQAYPKPAVALLSYGDPRKLDNNTNDSNQWPDYVKELGLSLADVPHLIRILNDPTLQHTESDEPEAWADVHAWRALGQLGAVDAIADLIRCLDDDEDEVSDWTMEEIPRVLARIGTPCIEPLSLYLNDGTKGCWNLAAAGEGLVCIAKENPESRHDCIAAITHRLERYLENDEMLNGFLICDLMQLKAVESLEVIRYAFQADAVDISIGGDLEDVEIDLGVRQTRLTPRPHNHICGIHCDPEEKEGWVRNLPPPQSVPKIGRNDPCLCGSGKKYKKCCLT